MIEDKAMAGQNGLEDPTNNLSPEQPLMLHLRWVPRCLRYDHGPVEATGLALDFYARAYILMSSIFLGPALLELATEAANCESEQNCDARIYGMKPSSLLSNIAIMSGLLASFSMPIIGAVVDHTSYRLQVGKYSGYILSTVKLIEALVSSSTWYYVAWLQVLSGLFYYAHILATYAYTSELSDDTTEQTKYNTYFFTVLYASTLIYMAKILTLSNVFDQDDVGTARISQVVTGLTSGIMFIFSWTFFRNRPPTSTIPLGQSLWTVGFHKVWKTSGEIYRTMPALKRLMGSVLFAESAMGTIVTVATTYMSTFMDMSSSEIGVVFLVVLIMGIPGAKLGEWLALKINPLTSAKICILLLLVSTGLAAIVLTGPEHKHYVVIFGVLWGISMGWLHPMHTVLFLGLTPDHARTEYMGIYIFCQLVLSWLPPLVFTVLNELGVSMSIGMASLNIFFVLGLISLQSIGRYDQLAMAVPTVVHTSGVAMVELRPIN
jgi:UMF1 family MFS transporter